MLTAMPAELLDYGLLSGLQTQSEISELLEELNYDALKKPLGPETGSVSRTRTPIRRVDSVLEHFDGPAELQEQIYGTGRGGWQPSLPGSP
jgi:hypothetical protein